MRFRGAGSSANQIFRGSGRRPIRFLVGVVWLRTVILGRNFNLIKFWLSLCSRNEKIGADDNVLCMYLARPCLLFAGSICDRVVKSLSTFFEQFKQNALICFRTKLTVNIVVQLNIERLVVSG